jgi:phage terminase small subunit
MTKGSIDAKRKIFIQEMVPVTTVAGMIEAYKKAYPTCKKDTTARVGAYALLQNPDIVKAIDELKKEREAIIAKVQKEEIERLARAEIVSQAQLEANLSKIAMGTFRRKRVIAAIDIKSGKIIKGEVDEAPTETDMISAADKLLKIKGAYAPDKQVHEAGDSFIAILQAVTSKKNKDGVPDGSH